MSSLAGILNDDSDSSNGSKQVSEEQATNAEELVF
jgi:hypothetical protein